MPFTTYGTFRVNTNKVKIILYIYIYIYMCVSFYDD